jgi:hypothetical protein
LSHSLVFSLVRLLSVVWAQVIRMGDEVRKEGAATWRADVLILIKQ